MNVKFYKYQGAGNDFILIDNRDHLLNPKDYGTYNRWCDRHFGIGADGLMFLQNHRDYDFEMVYLNSDGRESSMCGNGGRCIVAFARDLGLISDKTRFLAVDGIHQATIDANNVCLKMNDVKEVASQNGSYFLDTGSPHHVEFTDDVHAVDVYRQGKVIRNAERYKSIHGTNVNFVQNHAELLQIRTYERGVENETLACGTGAVAAAMAASVKNDLHGKIVYPLQAMGGKLKVHFNKSVDNTFTDVWLEGPADFVFEGEIGSAHI